MVRMSEVIGTLGFYASHYDGGKKAEELLRKIEDSSEKLEKKNKAPHRRTTSLRRVIEERASGIILSRLSETSLNAAVRKYGEVPVRDALDRMFADWARDRRGKMTEDRILSAMFSKLENTKRVHS